MSEFTPRPLIGFRPLAGKPCLFYRKGASAAAKFMALGTVLVGSALLFGAEPAAEPAAEPVFGPAGESVTDAVAEPVFITSGDSVFEPLTMRAVIALALQNNGQIKGTDLGKVIEEEKIKAAKLAFDLHLAGGYLYQSIDSPQNAQDYVATGGGTASVINPAQPILTTPNIFQQRNHIAKLGLNQKLESGMTLELGTTTRVLDNTLNRSLPPALFNPEWETFTGLTVTQPLMRDWGRAANTAEIRIAQANAKVADLEWQSRTAQVVAEVMKRYYDVVFTLENMKVQRESIALAQKLLDDTKARGAEGVAAGNDVRVAEAGVYQRREDALAAEMQYIERQNALQLLFKSPDEVIARSSRIRPVDGLRVKAPAANRAALVNTALERRYEVQQAAEMINVKSAEVDYTTSQARPRLDLVASGGFHGLDGDLGGSYDEAASSQGPEWTAGVQFSIPLNLDHLHAARRGAEDERTRAHVRRGEARLLVALEVDTVISRLRTDEQRLVATRKSREAAAQSAEGGLQRLREGVTTSFEVLQLQKEFSQARSREYAALADLNKDIVDLYLAIGTLLEEQGVMVQSDAEGTRRKYDKVPATVPVMDTEGRKQQVWEAEADAAVIEASSVPTKPKRPSFSKPRRK